MKVLRHTDPGPVPAMSERLRHAQPGGARSLRRKRFVFRKYVGLTLLVGRAGQFSR